MGIGKVSSQFPVGLFIWLTALAYLMVVNEISSAIPYLCHNLLDGEVAYKRA